MSSLVKYDAACRAIAEAKQVDEVRDIRDKSVAVEAYARQAKNRDLELDAAEIRLRAERRLGELLKDLPKNEGAKGIGKSPRSAGLPRTHTLDELGIDKHLADRARKLQSVPQQKFETLLGRVRKEAEKDGGPLHSLLKRELFQDARERDQDARRHEAFAVETTECGDGWTMHGGDFTKLKLPRSSVDLILTDPPYPKESLPIWEDLGKFALSVLKPQGILLAMSGQIFLPDVLNSLSKSLYYGWVYSQPLTSGGQQSRIMGRHIMQCWKPIVAFSNGAWPSGAISWHADVLQAGVMKKSQYRWQQDEDPVKMLIDVFTKEGQVVCDPMAGVGSFGKAVLSRGRKFIGVEIDTGRFKKCVASLGGDRE